MICSLHLQQEGAGLLTENTLMATVPMKVTGIILSGQSEMPVQVEVNPRHHTIQCKRRQARGSKGSPMAYLENT